MCNNFDVNSKNNIYFVYLKFTMNCTSFILEFKTTIYIYCEKAYFNQLNPIYIYILHEVKFLK